MAGGKNVLAVCDPEKTYVCSFAEYIHRKNSIPFEIQAFTDIRPLCEFASGRRIEILLISDRLMCEEVQDCEIGQIVILSEGVHHPDLDCYPSVYKYQSSDTVIREVMNCCDAQQEVRFTDGRQGGERIAVYSPVGRTAKTSFALTLGQVIAREQSVLYVNLEEYAGFEQLLGCRYERNLGDLIYYIRQEYKGLALKLGGMVQSVNNLDYLPPALSPLDIQNTRPEEWTRLLEVIENETSYRSVILDIGDGVNDLYTLLNQCSVIYMPVRTDVMSQAKLQQFEDLMRMWDYSGLLEKIQKIKLPYHRTDKLGKAYLDELIWSELGDYVRKLLRKEEENELL